MISNHSVHLGALKYMVVLPIFNQNMKLYFRFSIKIRCKDTVFFDNAKSFSLKLH